MPKMKWSEHGTFDSHPRCACCDKKINLDTAQWVEVINGGADFISPGVDIADINDPGYMGWFPIGPTCFKKHFRGA